MSFKQKEKKNLDRVKSRRQKEIAVPNYRCKYCTKFDALYRQWAKAYCQDCGRYAKGFIWFCILDLFIDIKRLQKDFLKVHDEGVYLLEQISSLKEMAIDRSPHKKTNPATPLDQKTDNPIIVL